MVIVDELARIRQSINLAQGHNSLSSPQNSTDLVLAINRLNGEHRATHEAVTGMVSDFIANKGRTSMKRWQINAVVRSVLAHRTNVTHDDLSRIEAGILRKETGLPGTN